MTGGGLSPGTLRNEPVTTMFTELVKPDKTDEFEAWSTGIHGDIKQFPGFLGVDVIRPDESNHPEYITLVKFDNCENLMRWKESPNLAKWLEKLLNLLISDSHAQECAGLDLWFDRPNIPQKLKEPPFWKQVAIGVICVYPLIMLLRWALEPVTGGLPGSIALLLNEVILSALLTYPVMPWVTRLLRPWLYPK
jgi:antibiotic biosynthesis monooxygenase (ABM) superfamily enzyme